MRVNVLSAIEYIRCLAKKYNEQSQAAYRIIDVKQSEHGEHMLQVQVVGKTVSLNLSPREIVLDDQLLALFSSQDVRMITFLACKELQTEPAYKIISQEINEDVHIQFKLREMNSNKEFTVAAKDIVSNKKLVRNLSVEDVQCTSYAAGYEHAQRGK